MRKMGQKNRGSVAAIVLGLGCCLALGAGLAAGPQRQEPGRTSASVNPADQRVAMIQLLQSIDNRLAAAIADSTTTGGDSTRLLGEVAKRLETIDLRLKQIEVELHRANQGE